MTITFYDIPSATPESAWSLNSWRIRFALNYKQIPYKTEWLEWADIEPHAKKHGIAPTGTNADGSPFYSVPAIYDASTNTYVSDSVRIAEYLDTTYPSTPALFPSNTEGLQLALTDAFWAQLANLWTLIVPVVYTRMNPVSHPYFRRTREAMFGGVKLEDLAPKGDAGKAQWEKFHAALGNVDGWYAKNGGQGPYLTGDKPIWGDFVVAGVLIWIRIIFGKDSEQWKDVSSWHGGRWGNLLDSLKEYQTIV